MKMNDKQTNKKRVLIKMRLKILKEKKNTQRFPDENLLALIVLGD